MKVNIKKKKKDIKIKLNKIVGYFFHIKKIKNSKKKENEKMEKFYRNFNYNVKWLSISYLVSKKEKIKHNTTV